MADELILYHKYGLRIDYLLFAFFATSENIQQSPMSLKTILKLIRYEVHFLFFLNGFQIVDKLMQPFYPVGLLSVFNILKSIVHIKILKAYTTGGV